MNEWKKLVSLNLVLAMVIGMIPMPAYAEEVTVQPEITAEQPAPSEMAAEESTEEEPVALLEEPTVAEIVASGYCGVNLGWKLDDIGTLTIYGEGEMDDYPWEAYNASIKKIIIEEGVTSICDDAFDSCAVEMASLPPTVEEIGYGAFAGCTALEIVNINNYRVLMTVADNAFPDTVNPVYRTAANNEEITEWDLDMGVTATLYGDCSLVLSGEGEIPDYSTKVLPPWYNARGSITRVKIEDGITEVGNRAFYGFSAITDLSIPDSVTSIGYDSFHNNGVLTKVEIGKGIRSIGKRAFAGCQELEKVLIDNYQLFVEIAADAFVEFTEITYAYIEADAVLMSWDISENISATLYGNGCVELSGVGEMPNEKLADLDPNAPWDSVTEIVVGYGISSVGCNIFSHMSKLRSVTLPESIVVIGNQAFYNCASLTSLWAGSNIETIGYSALAGCSADLVVTGPRNSPLQDYCESNGITYEGYAVDSFFSIGGVSYAADEAARGPGWDYNGQRCLLLERYSGIGNIVVPDRFLIVSNEDNVVYGSIQSEGDIEVVASAGSLKIVTSDIALQAVGLALASWDGDIMVETSCDVAVQVERLDVVEGEIEIKAAVTALNCKALQIYDRDEYDIFTSPNAYEPAGVYIGEPYLRITYKTIQTILHANGGTWSDQTDDKKYINRAESEDIYLGDFVDKVSNDGHVLAGWYAPEIDAEYEPKGYASTGNLIYAVWQQNTLQVGGKSYDPSVAHLGAGWKYAPADGVVSASLEITEDYNGRSIWLTETLQVTITGPVTIDGIAGEPAIYSMGDLRVDMFDEVVLRGGAGAHGVEALGQITVYSGGKTAIYGGEGGAGIAAEWTKLQSDNQLTIVGGLRSHAVSGKIDLQNHENGQIILIAGAEQRQVASNSLVESEALMKYYVGENAANYWRIGSIEKIHQYSYVRIQPKTIILNLDANGGEIQNQGLIIAEVAQDANDSFVLLEDIAPVRPVYRFIGWNTKADGSGSSYESGQNYAVDAEVDTLTLFAQWEKLDFTAVLNEDKTKANITIAKDIPTDAVLILVGYAENGKMLHCAFGQKQEIGWIFDFVDNSGIREWSLFLVNNMCTPIEPVRKLQFYN